MADLFGTFALTDRIANGAAFNLASLTDVEITVTGALANREFRRDAPIDPFLDPMLIDLLDQDFVGTFAPPIVAPVGGDELIIVAGGSDSGMTAFRNTVCAASNPLDLGDLNVSGSYEDSALNQVFSILSYEAGGHTSPPLRGARIHWCGCA